MAFAVSPHNPIVAFGIVNEFTLGATPSEGAQTFTFTNTGPNAVVVGDPVFVRSSDETVLQYLGTATAVTTANITSTVPLQDAVGASATLWVPSNYVLFTGEIRESQGLETDDGTVTRLTQAGAPLNYQFKDPVQTIRMSFWVRESTAHADWLDFLATDRRGSIDSFNFAYYDMDERITKTIKCKVVAGGHTSTRIMHNRTSFTESFIKELDSADFVTGVYVES